jgi:hypothetical protein
MDEADAAAHQEELARAAATKKRYATLPACGFCYSCTVSLGAGLRFCDAECMADWEHAEKMRKLKGGE